MPFNLQNYLIDNAVRLRRHGWGGGGTTMLAQEIYTLLLGIPRGVDDITSRDPNGNPIVLPDFDFPTFPGFPPIDPDFPDDPTVDPPEITPPTPVDPNDPQDPNEPPADPPVTTGTQTRTHRNAFPGKIISRSGTTFDVDVYRNGPATTPQRVSASCVDAAFDESSYDDQWVVVFMVATYRHTVTQAAFQTIADMVAESVSYTFMPPAVATGLAVTTSAIAAQSSNTPGSGTATLRVYSGGSWSDGESITLYNSASSEVANNKLVQWKTVAGLKFVDVEDCG